MKRIMILNVIPDLKSLWIFQYHFLITQTGAPDLVARCKVSSLLLHDPVLLSSLQVADGRKVVCNHNLHFIGF
jgi:hypothetical protein